MVHKPKKKQLYLAAKKLRKNGLSIGAIAKKFLIAKSTASLWCRDIKLSPSQTNQLIKNSRAILKLGAKTNHDKRIKEIENIQKAASNKIKSFNKDSFFIAGIFLYWAEGHKSKSFSITNSDERIIIFMLKWLKRVFNAEIKKEVKAYLHIHAGDDDLKIKKYWSKITGIPLVNFGKSFIKPKGTGQRTKILPHGIIRIRLAGKGTENKRHMVMAWIDKLYKIS